MNDRGKGTAGNDRRGPRKAGDPPRSHKRIGNEADQSDIDRLRRSRTAPAAAPAADHGRIAERAYSIWQQRGCPPGQDVVTWCEAEAELEPGPQR